MQIELQCVNCKHLRAPIQCDAFKVIPDEIFITGEHDHTQPYDGDHGIQFEPVDAK